MAEAILFGLAQKMIENLGSQTFQEIGSLWGVEDELEKIKNTVSRIQAVLQDAAEQQSHNHQVKDWLQKLNDAVYDADDLLSEFSTEATRRSMVSGNKVTKEEYLECGEESSVNWKEGCWNLEKWVQILCFTDSEQLLGLQF